MSPTRLVRWCSLADVVLLPIFVLWFIWQLQFTARWTWVFFVLWLVISFALHRDTPKTLGWRADNLAHATRQAFFVFGGMAVVLMVIGFALHMPTHRLGHLYAWPRVGSYFAFCLLQQVALNSLVHNRMLSLIHVEWIAAASTALIFAVIHWPNPVLVPATFVAGFAMALLFGRHRNVIPLAVGQAILGILASWAFPVEWQHHLRVGPGFYNFPN